MFKFSLKDALFLLTQDTIGWALKWQSSGDEGGYVTERNGIKVVFSPDPKDSSVRRPSLRLSDRHGKSTFKQPKLGKNKEVHDAFETLRDVVVRQIRQADVKSMKEVKGADRQRMINRLMSRPKEISHT